MGHQITLGKQIERHSHRVVWAAALAFRAARPVKPGSFAAYDAAKAAMIEAGCDPIVANDCVMSIIASVSYEHEGWLGHDNTEVGAWRDWQLSGTCRCGTRSIPLRSIGDLRGWDMRLDVLCRRLKCQQCGQPMRDPTLVLPDLKARPGSTPLRTYPLTNGLPAPGLLPPPPPE